jgi:Putative quorum-sensing-regulated virulence factor
MVTMPFGKYRGLPIVDLPTAYLTWLASCVDLREPLKGTVFAELDHRGVGARLGSRQSTVPPLGQPDVRVVDELVTAGLRPLAKKYHPDLGGDGEVMKQVSVAAEWIRGRLVEAVILAPTPSNLDRCDEIVATMGEDLAQLLVGVAAHAGWQGVQLRRGQKKPEARNGEAPTVTRDLDQIRTWLWWRLSPVPVAAEPMS